MDAVNTIRAFVPGLVERQHGHVVVVSSNTAMTARPRYAAYASSKHAVLAIAESLQLDLRACNSSVLVTTVLPGPISSRMADTQLRRSPEFGAPSADPVEVKEIREFLEQRGDDPDDVADLVFDAMTDGRFYVFTRPENVELARARTDDISSGYLRSVTPPREQ